MSQSRFRDRQGRYMLIRLVSAAVLSFGTITTDGSAQQSTDIPAAVQPGVATLIARELLHVMRFDDDRDPSEGGLGQFTEITAETTLAYGLSRDWAVMLHLPIKHRDTDSVADAAGVEDGFGVEGPVAMLQYRFWQDDQIGINTQRAVLQLGAELPIGSDRFSSDSLDPIVGLAYTRIRGRHGFNVAAQWKFTTGDGDDAATGFGDSIHDALYLTGSYLHRLAPERYTIETTGSHYVQVQLLHFYETNGDTALHLAPGWMYEGRTWAFEATVHLPIAQDLDDRPDSEWGLSLGVRCLF
ncbi:MAG: hypothetical protein AAF916_08450 [Planctomycetota bacterium]